MKENKIVELPTQELVDYLKAVREEYRKTMKKERKIAELPIRKYLSGKEYEEYMGDLKKVIGESVEKVIFIADKHNIDRDDAMQNFSVMLRGVVEFGTFQNWSSK